MKDKRSLRHLGGKRYRESPGLTYDEIEPGAVIEHRPGRTVIEADNIWLSNLAMNPSPLHIDAAYAAETQWHQPLVSSLVTFSIVNAMSVASLSMRAIANLGWDAVRMTAPVFVGDTLYAESTVLSKRPSKSDPSRGVVRFATRGLKSDGTEVMHCERSILMAVVPEGLTEEYF
ncbi:MAG: MaoC family dehydratase [Rhodobacter sp.]|nr:MaoC family dehydratase [Rhodobacter sp.]